jgi:membrane protein DedA with SNARE-associated domain
MLNAFIAWALSLTQGLGYMGIAILMTVESSLLPFPSEIIIPPAAYLASQGKMNLLLVVIIGILGSLIGASINYILAYYLGRPLIYKLASKRWAHLLLITPEKIERSEKYFLNNANSATFIGRLIPMIRQLVSLPAGFSRMPFGRFIALTALGSGLWVSILAALGYLIGSNQVLLSYYYREISWVLLILGAIYLIWKIFKNKSRK